MDSTDVMPTVTKSRQVHVGEHRWRTSVTDASSTAIAPRAIGGARADVHGAFGGLGESGTGAAHPTTSTRSGLSAHEMRGTRFIATTLAARSSR